MGSIALDLVAGRTSAFQRDIKNQSDTAAKSMTGIFSSAFKKIGTLAATAFGVKAITAFSKECIDLGSDLTEVQNVVDVTFGKDAEKINAFAKTTATAFGISKKSAKQYTGTMGAMLKSMGFSTDTALDMSTAITGLSGDMASFYNLDTDTAFEKIRSGISGETEPLKQLGINMSVANLEAFALSQGITTAYNSMSQSNQALLRHNYLMSVTKDAQGDFSRTSDSWANQVKVLQLNFDSLKSSIGQMLISVLTPFLKSLNSLISYANEAVSALQRLFNGGESNSTTASLGNVSSAAVTATADMTDTQKAAETTAKKIKGAFASIDEIHTLGSQDTTASDTDTASALNSVNSAVGSTNTEISKTEEKIKGLTDLIAKINFEPLKNSLSGLKTTFESFKSIASDSLKWVYDEILKPLGEWTVEEALPAAIDMLSAAFKALCSVFEALQPTAEWFWDEFLQPIAEWTADKIVDTLENITDLLTAFSDWCEDNPNVVTAMAVTLGSFFAVWKGIELAEFITNAGGVIGILGSMVNAFKLATFGKIQDKIETLALAGMYAKDTVISIGQTISAKGKELAAWVSSTAAKVADKAVLIAHTVATTAATAATWLFNTAMTVLTSPITLVVLAIGALIAIIVLLVKNWDTVKAVAISTWEKIKETFKNVANWFKEKVINPIVNFFTGMWNKIKGIINAIIGGFEGMVNGVVKGVNKMINAINSIKINIPDWLGGGTLGFNLKTISEVALPRLAQGGYFPANSPQLAIVGDNKREGEITTPESKIREQVELAMRSAGNSVSNSQLGAIIKQAIIEALKELGNIFGGDWTIVIVDESGNTKATQVISAAQRANRRSGKTVITVGV